MVQLEGQRNVSDTVLQIARDYSLTEFYGVKYHPKACGQNGCAGRIGLGRGLRLVRTSAS